MDVNFIIIEKLNCFINRINKSSKKTKDYNTGISLHRSEIHTIECIYNHKETNASTLANILEITNGALNQMTTKLIKKNLIVQYHKNNNKKEVFYQLTDLGEIANETHKNLHSEVYNSILSYINNLNTNERTTIYDFLDNLIDNWKV
jgi:DNA-binding MarR family transcriptional regulator